MIEGNSEIKIVLRADVASSLWEKPVLLKEQAAKWTKARVNVHSDFVLCLGRVYGPEDAAKRWTDQVSTSKMCHTFRELQGLDGEPIDFEWKIFPGVTALDILHEIQADLQGKHITPDNLHVNDQRHCAGRKGLGRGVLKKKKNNNRDMIHYNGEYCNIDLLDKTMHSANQLCIYGAVTKWCETNSEESGQSRFESARKTSPESQIKQEDLKSLIDILRLPDASGNRMLQSLKDFNSISFMNKTEYLRTTAKFHHPIEKGNHYVTIILEDDGWGKGTSMCKEYTAPRHREDSKPYLSIDANREIGPFLNIWTATIIDFPGFEVQVPSLSSPGHSEWILISRGHDRFVNEIHRQEL